MSFRKSEHFRANSDQCYFNGPLQHLDLEVLRVLQHVLGALVEAVQREEHFPEHFRVALLPSVNFEDFFAQDLSLAFTWKILISLSRLTSTSEL